MQALSKEVVAAALSFGLSAEQEREREREV
jgi:hypothetical protein